MAKHSSGFRFFTEMSEQETELRVSNASKPTPAGKTKSKFTNSWREGQGDVTAEKHAQELI